MTVLSALTIIYAIVVLLFGVFLSAACTGITLTKKNTILSLAFCAFSGILQTIFIILLGSDAVWVIYPLITHIPLILYFMIVFHKRAVTAVASVFTAYLCCQPSKWLALFTLYVTGSETIQIIVRILAVMITAAITIRFIAPYLSEIFNKDTRSVCIFGMIPTAYAFFDYFAVAISYKWRIDSLLMAEVMPFFLCIVFVLFCFIYYKEYELKADAQRKEQVISISLRQQQKELSALKHREQDLRILHHDMRHLFNYLTDCLDNGDIDSAKKIIDGYVSNINDTTLKIYCQNQTINYIISHYNDKCREENIDFITEITISDISIDETIFFSILSNALDNAFNALLDLPEKDRKITLMLKESGSKLLLMVKNPCSKVPVFIDGLPASDKKGHGYGTQSILHMTEVLGGKCQFTMDGNEFVLRAII
ncbi:MAG: sensor histidine kinase [Clostridiales bacterium]|nr:sensor histidine kinase [Clostridiales bacterium]